MHGYSRLGSGAGVGGGVNGGRSVTATTTPSPPSSPRLRHARPKKSSSVVCATGDAGGARFGVKQSRVERLIFMVIAAVFKRRGVLLLAPLVYIAGMLLYMGSLNFDVNVNLKSGAVIVRKKAPPGTVYRSPQVFEKLWPYMEAENNGSYNALMTAWDPKLRTAWKPCGLKNVAKADMPESNGFLIIEANGQT